jgi:transglutaminase-like putative cysteine protease
MPTITDVTPTAVFGDLAALRNALDQSIPEKDSHDYLLIATWNLKSFGALTREWSAIPGDSPRRDLRCHEAREHAGAWREVPRRCTMACTTITRVVIALLAPGALLAQAEYQIGPPPAWVVNVAYATSVPPMAGTAAEGTELRLIDLQDRVEDGGMESFVHGVYRLLDEGAVQQSSQIEIVFDPSYQQLTLHSAAVTRDGHRIEQLKPAQIHVMRRETRLQFQSYDGSLSVVLLLEDVRRGDIIEYSYTRKGANPVFRGHYMATVVTELNFPLDHLYRRLLWPRDRSLFIRADKSEIEPTIREAGALREYVWDVRDIPPKTLEAAIPAWYRPFSTVQLSDFASWSDVAAWGASLFDVPQGSLEAIAKPLADIRAASDDPFEQLQAAVRFVQEEVRYLAIELGANAHRPYPPSTVIQRRYGDCKDKSLLLITMLRGLGIDARPALVSTVDVEHVADYHPTAAVFDHVIVQATYDGQDLWLDPTLLYQRDDFRTSPWRYGMALVLGPGVTSLSTVPEPPTRGPLEDILVQIALGDVASPSEFRVSTTHRGSSARGLRQWKSGTSPEEIARQSLDFYAELYPSIESTGAIQIEDDEAADIVRIRETYTVPGFWRRSDEMDRYFGTLYPLELARRLPSAVAANRTMPLGVSHPVHIRHQIEARLDEGWSISPEREQLETPAARFERRVSVEGEALTLVYEYETLADHVSPEAAPDHMRKMDRARELLEFTVTAPSKAAASWADPKELNWLIMLLTIVVLAFAVWLSARIYHLQPASFPHSPAPLELRLTPEVEGIGGWLILVAVGVCVTPFMIGWHFVQTLPVYAASTWAHLTTPGTGGYHAMWAPVLIFELVANVSLMVLGVLLALTFFRRKRLFPGLFVVLMIARLLASTADALLTTTIPAAAADSTTAMASSTVREWVVGIIWIAYMFRSRRVRNTFVN